MRIGAGQHVDLMAYWALETVQRDGNQHQHWLQLSKSLKPQDVCMRLSPFKHFSTYYAGHWCTDNILENVRSGKGDWPYRSALLLIDNDG